MRFKFFICLIFIAALTAAIIFLCVYIHSLLPVAAAAATAYIFSAAAGIFILAQNAPENSIISWLAVIIFLPVIGAVLYALSSLGGKRPRGKTPVYESCGYNAHTYYASGESFLKELVRDISRAQKSVYLEFYIIAKGRVWQSMFSALKGAIERGATVKIIFDGLGSALRAPYKDFKSLRRAGAAIKVFNRLMPAPLSRFNFRDHRKIAVIDGEYLYLGGVNVADEYAGITSPHGVWKDGGVRFTGDIAKVFSEIFLSSFHTEAPPLAAGGGGKNTLTPIADNPCREGSLCEDLLTRAIYSAKRRIYIFTPYLCLSGKLCDALASAAASGVEVKIIIPGIPDKKFTYSITKAYCAMLLRRGVQIYLYPDGFMHFKGVVCDGAALVGSYNLDFRSLRLNYECGVWAEGGVAKDVAADFESCLINCPRFDPDTRRMPLPLARLIAPLL